MITVTDLTQYAVVPFKLYETLADKLQALLDGEILFVKKFERQEGADVLVQLVHKKYEVTQISYDVSFNDIDPRYWVTFNIGMNDLSLFSCFKFEEGLFKHLNKFMINDIVTYRTPDGRQDSAIIEEVYVSIVDSDKYAYRLSRDSEVYAEDELTQYKY